LCVALVAEIPHCYPVALGDCVPYSAEPAGADENIACDFTAVAKHSSASGIKRLTCSGGKYIFRVYCQRCAAHWISNRRDHDSFHVLDGTPLDDSRNLHNIPSHLIRCHRHIAPCGLAGYSNLTNHSGSKKEPVVVG
jgi:hypothetical protein